MPSPVQSSGHRVDRTAVASRLRAVVAGCTPWLFAMAMAATASAQLDLTVETGFTARASATAAYDLSRGRTVVFGGSATDRAVWERSQTEWERIPVTESPDPRPGGTMVYAVQLAGCFYSSGIAGDGYWLWDGSQWRQLTTFNDPPPRRFHSMAFDAINQRVLLFGGLAPDGVTARGDTWELNPQTATWRLANNTMAPAPRHGASVSYDFERQKVYLHGGQSGSNVMSDTWEWDGGDWVDWGVIQPGPGARVGAAMAYDPLRQMTLLHGGHGSDSALWAWDGSTLQWSIFDPGTNVEAAAPRSFAGTVFDTFGGVMVRAGGRDANGLSTGGILEWNTVAIQHSTEVPQTAPPPQIGHLVPGVSPDKPISLGDEDGDVSVWRFQQDGWTQVPASNQAPATRIDSSVASMGSRLLVFGGLDSVTGQRTNTMDEWSVTTEQWRTIQAPLPRPEPRRRASWVYNPARNRFMLFGGEGDNGLLNDAWEYDHATQSWSRIGSVVPLSPRQGCGIAADPLTGKIVLYGGQAANDAPEFTDAWTWDIDDGFLRISAPGPAGRVGDFALVTDPFRERVVLVGGDPEGAVLWDFDGSNRQWSRRVPAPPGGMAQQDLTINNGIALRGRGLLFLGEGGEAWNIAPQFPPSIEGFGSACPGTNGRAFIAPVGGKEPWAGSPWSIGVAPVPAPGFALLALGFSETTWPNGSLPFDLTSSGMPQCTLWIDPAVVLASVGSSPIAEWHMNLPSDPLFLGARFYAQGFVMDPGANRRGLIATRALRVTIGGR